MSYILDALKKSEQERKKGRVPGLGTIQGLSGGRQDTTWPLRSYFWGTLLLLTVTAILAWLFFQIPQASQKTIVTPAPPPASITPAPTALVASPAPNDTLPDNSGVNGHRAERRPPKQAASPNPQRTLTPAASKGTPPHILPDHATPAVVATSPARLSRTKDAATTPQSPAPEATLSPATVKPAPFEASPTVENTENVPPPGATQGEEPEVVVKPEDMPIVPLAELPPELKGEMPEIKIGIHFFSDDPTSRRAGVNGRLLHEGQQVEKDLTLKEITRDGAILAFRGRRFSLPVFPR